MFSHAQVGPQRAEKQQSKVNVVGGGGNHYTYILLLMTNAPTIDPFRFHDLNQSERSM